MNLPRFWTGATPASKNVVHNTILRNLPRSEQVFYNGVYIHSNYHLPTDSYVENWLKRTHDKRLEDYAEELDEDEKYDEEHALMKEMGLITACRYKRFHDKHAFGLGYSRHACFPVYLNDDGILRFVDPSTDRVFSYEEVERCDAYVPLKWWSA